MHRNFLINCSKSTVQNDVDELVRESRKKLEVEIKAVLREASAIADRALARARTAQAAGISALVANHSYLRNRPDVLLTSYNSRIVAT